MKRVFLSLAVVLSFAVYSIHTQLEGKEAVTLVQTQKKQAGSPPATNTPRTSPSTPPKNTVPGYKDGTYTGSTEDVFYGKMQVRVTIAGGKIDDIEFLQYPNERRTSVEINAQAMPVLKQEAISAQSYDVDVVTGATASSNGFIASLANALAQAE